MHNKEKKLSSCSPPCPQLFNYILLELNMSIHLAHAGKFLESAGFIEGYPLSYTRGGRSVAWTGFIVIGPTSQLYAFVFDNHVVHDNAGVHYLENASDIPQTRWTLNCRPSSLEHTKCALHVLLADSCRSAK